MFFSLNLRCALPAWHHNGPSTLPSTDAAPRSQPSVSPRGVIPPLSIKDRADTETADKESKSIVTESNKQQSERKSPISIAETSQSTPPEPKMQVSIPRPIPHPLPREPSSSAPFSSPSAAHTNLRTFPFMFPPRDKNCSSQANRLLPNPALLSQSLAYRQFLALGAHNWKLDDNGYIPLPPTVNPYWRPPANLPFYIGENFPHTPNPFTYGHLNAPSKKLYACPECRYITDRKNNLKRHVGTMHKDCERVLECCGIFFKTKASLRDHVLIFHSNGYMCGHCGRNFCRKALLKRHMTVHSGQKDFVCPQCGYSTSHKSNLERHKKVHERELVDGTEIPDHTSGSPNSHKCDDVEHNISECLSDDSDDSDDICDEIDVVTS